MKKLSHKDFETTCRYIGLVLQLCCKKMFMYIIYMYILHGGFVKQIGLVQGKAWCAKSYIKFPKIWQYSHYMQLTLSDFIVLNITVVMWKCKFHKQRYVNNTRCVQNVVYLDIELDNTSCLTVINCLSTVFNPQRCRWAIVTHQFYQKINLINK